MKEEKEEQERIARALTKRDIKYKDYDGEVMSDRLWSAGKASYVERDQDMINGSNLFAKKRDKIRSNLSAVGKSCF